MASSAAAAVPGFLSRALTRPLRGYCLQTWNANAETFTSEAGGSAGHSRAGGLLCDLSGAQAWVAPSRSDATATLLRLSEHRGPDSAAHPCVVRPSLAIMRRDGNEAEGWTHDTIRALAFAFRRIAASPESTLAGATPKQIAKLASVGAVHENTKLPEGARRAMVIACLRTATTRHEEFGAVFATRLLRAARDVSLRYDWADPAAPLTRYVACVAERMPIRNAALPHPNSPAASRAPSPAACAAFLSVMRILMGLRVPCDPILRYASRIPDEVVSIELISRALFVCGRAKLGKNVQHPQLQRQQQARFTALLRGVVAQARESLGRPQCAPGGPEVEPAVGPIVEGVGSGAHLLLSALLGWVDPRSSSSDPVCVDSAEFVVGALCYHKAYAGGCNGSDIFHIARAANTLHPPGGDVDGVGGGEAITALSALLAARLPAAEEGGIPLEADRWLAAAVGEIAKMAAHTPLQPGVSVPPPLRDLLGRLLAILLQRGLPDVLRRPAGGGLEAVQRAGDLVCVVRGLCVSRCAEARREVVEDVIRQLCADPLYLAAAVEALSDAGWVWEGSAGLERVCQVARGLSNKDQLTCMLRALAKTPACPPHVLKAVMQRLASVVRACRNNATVLALIPVLRACNVYHDVLLRALEARR